MIKGWRFAVGGFLTALVFGGCASTEPPPQLPLESIPTASAVLYEWNPEVLYEEPSVFGGLSVVIDLRIQRAEVFIGGLPAGWSMVATGKEGYNTPAGRYTVLQKVVDKHSTLYGKIVDASGDTVKADADVRRDRPPPGGRFVFAPMPYWMRLTWGGIGMHAGPIPRPGRPASHGCIRLPRDFATQLFEMIRIGTPVEIIR
jgi:lipoprotein-anchoring transpeptidase ErfK/SrfK